MAHGRDVQFISESLVLSPNTVRTHVYRVFGKVGVHGRQSHRRGGAYVRRRLLEHSGKAGPKEGRAAAGGEADGRRGGAQALKGRGRA